MFTVAASGDAWIDQQWLAHLVYYGSWTLGGYPLVAIVSSAAVAIAFGLLTAFQISRGTHPQRAVLWSAAAFVVCMGNWKYPALQGRVAFDARLAPAD